MEHSRDGMFYDFSVFNDEMETIDFQDKERIIDFCKCVEHYLYDNGFICRQYQVYQEEWEAFERKSNRRAENKTLYELLVYLFIYSREEYWSGGNGESYVRAFKNGTIPDIVKMLVEKLEVMAISESNNSDKSGTIGIAGEHFVAAELTRRGYVATLTSKNTKAIDILVSDKVGNRVVAVQVKACDNPKQIKWKLGEKVEENFTPNLYYVFVNMNAGETPSYYVVPSRYVAYRVRKDYEEWLNTPGKNGQARNETTMRTFEFVDDEERRQYQDAWYILGI